MRKKKWGFWMTNKLKSDCSYFNVQNIGERAELYIYDQIGKDWWDDSGISDKEFVDALKNVKGKPLDVHINSIGGNVFEGIAIYNAIKQHDAEVNIYIDGLAASIASVIACASDNVYLANGASIMIHDVSAGIYARGTTDDIKKAYERTMASMENAKESILNIYEEKTGKDRAYLQNLMNGDNYFRGQDAIDLGIASEIIDPSPTDRLKNSLDVMLREYPQNEQIQAVMNRLFSAPNLPTNPPKQPILNNKGNTMKNNTDENLALQFKINEEKRKASIKALFENSNMAELENSCLLDLDCTVENAQEKLLEALKKQNNVAQNKATDKPITGITTQTDAIDNKIQAIKSAWGARAEGKIDANNEFKFASINSAINTVLLKNGITPGHSRAESVDLLLSNKVHTMDDFKVLMGDFVYRSLLHGYQLKEASWKKFCSTGSFEDFREQELHSIGVMGDLEDKGADDKYVDGVLPDTEIQRYKAKQKGRIYRINRETLINDDMGVIHDMMKQAGIATNRTIDNHVWRYIVSNPVLKDGKALFHADHGNLLDAGVNSVDTWKAMLRLFKEQKAVNSDAFLNIKPEYILTDLEGMFLARELLIKETGKEAKPTIGWFAEENIIDSEYMASFGTVFLANKDADPMFRVGFLHGQEGPNVIFDEDFDSAGLKMRIMSDFGIGTMNYRGAVLLPKVSGSSKAAKEK